MIVYEDVSVSDSHCLWMFGHIYEYASQAVSKKMRALIAYRYKTVLKNECMSCESLYKLIEQVYCAFR